MKKIKDGFIMTSAALTISRKQIRSYLLDPEIEPEHTPSVGDVLYGEVDYIGQHSSLENKKGRIHYINNKTRAIFVLGNRYAPDYYEGFVPSSMGAKLDLLSRSGIVGDVKYKNASIKDPTRIKIFGYVADENGNVLNTLNYPKINPKNKIKNDNRAKLILVVGTSMNSGKSMSAAACCWALSSMGHAVRGSKITGTASLKDILLMEDNGASYVSDFTYFGYPSTYMLEEKDLLRIFNDLDLKYANSRSNYWVVEIADGILQRETAMLLSSPEVTSRIHKLIFSSYDALGCRGALNILKHDFGLVPDAISGVCSSSPLGVREIESFTDIPVFSNMQRDLNKISSILI